MMKKRSLPEGRKDLCRGLSFKEEITYRCDIQSKICEFFHVACTRFGAVVRHKDKFFPLNTRHIITLLLISERYLVTSDLR